MERVQLVKRVPVVRRLLREGLLAQMARVAEEQVEKIYAVGKSMGEVEGLEYYYLGVETEELPEEIGRAHV